MGGLFSFWGPDDQLPILRSRNAPQDVLLVRGVLASAGERREVEAQPHASRAATNPLPVEAQSVPRADLGLELGRWVGGRGRTDSSSAF